jgi:hypothetical protein
VRRLNCNCFVDRSRRSYHTNCSSIASNDKNGGEEKRGEIAVRIAQWIVCAFSNRLPKGKRFERKSQPPRLFRTRRAREQVVELIMIRRYTLMMAS